MGKKKAKKKAVKAVEKAVRKAVDKDVAGDDVEKAVGHAILGIAKDKRGADKKDRNKKESSKPTKKARDDSDKKSKRCHRGLIRLPECAAAIVSAE